LATESTAVTAYIPEPFHIKNSYNIMRNCAEWQISTFNADFKILVKTSQEGLWARVSTKVQKA